MCQNNFRSALRGMRMCCTINCGSEWYLGYICVHNHYVLSFYMQQCYIKFMDFHLLRPPSFPFPYLSFSHLPFLSLPSSAIRI